jgi:hypothetical protein
MGTKIRVSETGYTVIHNDLKKIECAKPPFDEFDKELPNIIDGISRHSNCIIIDQFGDLNI